MDFKGKELMELKEFLDWRRNNPEDYDLFLKDMKELMKDLIQVATEINKVI